MAADSRSQVPASALHIVVLAAGKGTRMKSSLPKVLHRAAGMPLIDHVLLSAAPLGPASTVVIVGHQTEIVREHFGKRPDVRLALQEPQLGTGHALLQAEPFLLGKSGTVLLLSGDVPLLRESTVRALVAHHVSQNAAATVLTAIVARPDGYGRIVRQDGAISAIVEHKDASASERAIAEINSGVYVFDLPPLFDALREVGSGTPRGNTIFPIWSEFSARNGFRWRRCGSTTRRRSWASTAGRS